MGGRGAYREWEEAYEVFGVVYRFCFRGPVEEPPRWEVAVLDLGGVPVVPRPVRGRTEDETRWRAEEVLRTWAAVRRLHAAAARAAVRTAPGAEVVLNERAEELEVELAGPWVLRAPYLASRDQVTDPHRTEEEWETSLELHFRSHAVRVGQWEGP
jgi:xanthine/CO dehydrogenase XdhC/CoxF family maturation factor